MRTVTQIDGRYVHLEDLKESLRDDPLMLEAMAMLPVGRDKGDPPAEVMRHAIGCWLATAVGDLPRVGAGVEPKWAERKCRHCGETI